MNVHVNYYAQHALDVLDPHRTVLEEASLVADMETVPMVRSILGAFGFSGQDVDKRVGVLSGGEKSRLALSRMLIRPGNVLLLDEPTNHLDMASREVLEAAMADFGGSMVFISHDRYFINRVATEVVEVNAGGHVVRYPGDFDGYLHLKEAHRQHQEALQAGSNGAGSGKQNAGNACSSPATDRDRKRREADLRNRLYRETLPLRTRLGDLEQQIAKVEGRLGEVILLQSDPRTYQDPELIRDLAVEKARLEPELEKLLDEWEQVGARLEEIGCASLEAD